LIEPIETIYGAVEGLYLALYSFLSVHPIIGIAIWGLLILGTFLFAQLMDHLER
jgi:hypothetical protein